MKTKIVCVGRVRESFLREGVEEYVKRMKPLLPLEIKPVREGRGDSAERLKESEADSILAAIGEGDVVIALDERGEERDSMGLASLLEELMKSGARSVVFAIGGPRGLSKRVLGRATRKLALSRLTFTHELALLILAEQLYRAVKILRGEPYHY